MGGIRKDDSMITTIAGVITLVLFVCLIVYVAVAAGLRPKSLDRKKIGRAACRERVLILV